MFLQRRTLKNLAPTKKPVFSRGVRPCSSYEFAAEQKARVTYDNILRLVDDPDVCDPIKFLRQRELTHYQRFGEALRIAQDNSDAQNFYGWNPAFDKVNKK